MTQAVVGTTRRRLVADFLSASWSVQSSERAGRLQELLTTFTDACSSAVTALAQGTINLFNFAALLTTAIIVNAIASIAAAVAAVAVALLLRPLRDRLRRLSGRAAAANLEFATAATEMSSMAQEVRVFGAQAEVERQLGDLNERYLRQALRAGYLSGSIGIAYQGVALLVILGAMAIAYGAEIGGLASLGAVILIMLRCLSYAQGVQSSLQSLHQTAPYLETLTGEFERLEGSVEPSGSAELERVESLEFRDVAYRYPNAPRDALTSTDFTIKAGEIIGVIGPSGSGKSTLVQLLLRLREPSAGAMLVNGRNAAEFRSTDWPKQIAFVPQDTHLFSGTIADNIRFHREGISDDAVIEAAQRAHVHDDILKKPEGYDTMLGERGATLSGGERQRLSIARALLKNTPILVLDEPTSALDVHSESAIRNTLRELSPPTTVVVIAHRLSTLAICDRLIVLIDGKIQAIGSPAELAVDNAFYREALRVSGLT
jgi:ABC-type multidrug transport system fused ATPase/permease subunit